LPFWNITIPLFVGLIVIVVAVTIFGIQLLKLALCLLNAIFHLIKSIWILPKFAKDIKYLKAKGQFIDYHASMSDTIQRAEQIKKEEAFRKWSFSQHYNPNRTMKDWDNAD